MEFKIYVRNFDDGAVIAGSKEVENPVYDGKCLPIIEVMKNTGEIMATRLMPNDCDYWANAGLVDSLTYSFLVHELGGREKIIATLKKITENK